MDVHQTDVSPIIPVKNSSRHDVQVGTTKLHASLVEEGNNNNISSAQIRSRFGQDSSGMKDISSIRSKTKSELSYDVFNKFMANNDHANMYAGV